MLRRDEYDIHRPDDATGELPGVVFLHGPAPIPLRDSPLLAAYARLAGARGCAGVVLDLRYRGVENWPPGTIWPPHADWLGTAEWVAEVVDRVRAEDGIDPNRIAVWAFSGAGMLTGGWLADSPAWLRCLALTYPVLADQTPGSSTPAPCDRLRPGRPIVLTRVGRERPEYQATVDRLLVRAEEVGADVTVIDVPEGEHGFDAAVPSLAECAPVLSAFDEVVKHLRDT
ncbi:alpha/beta hydrolase [Nocardia sp. NPDC003482]